MADVDGSTGGGEPAQPAPSSIERSEDVLVKPASPTVEKLPPFPGEEATTAVGAADIPVGAMNGSAEDFTPGEPQEPFQMESSNDQSLPTEQADEASVTEQTQLSVGLELDVGSEVKELSVSGADQSAVVEENLSEQKDQSLFSTEDKLGDATESSVANEAPISAAEQGVLESAANYEEQLESSPVVQSPDVAMEGDRDDRDPTDGVVGSVVDVDQGMGTQDDDDQTAEVDTENQVNGEDKIVKVDEESSISRHQEEESSQIPYEDEPSISSTQETGVETIRDEEPPPVSVTEEPFLETSPNVEQSQMFISKESKKEPKDSVTAPVIEDFGVSNSESGLGFETREKEGEQGSPKSVTRTSPAKMDPVQTTDIDAHLSKDFEDDEGVALEDSLPSLEEKDVETEPNRSAIEQFSEETSRQILEMGMGAELETSKEKPGAVEQSEVTTPLEKAVAEDTKHGTQEDNVELEKSKAKPDVVEPSKDTTPEKVEVEVKGMKPDAVEPSEDTTPEKVEDTKPRAQVENAELKDESGTQEEAKDEASEEKVMDILGNGLLIKKILTPGEGKSTRPVHGDLVSVKVEGKLEDGTAVESHDALQFTLGDGDVIQAFDLGVALMDKGEACELTTDSKYAYGSLGDNTQTPNIPPNAKLTYSLGLLNVEESPDITKLTVPQRTEFGDKKRERGNYYFGREEYTQAISLYTKALQILDESHGAKTDDASQLQMLLDTRIKCYNNLALAQYKVEAYDAAIKSCDNVLGAQPDNVKALFRKGKCCADKGNLEDAIAVFRKALVLEPQRKNIHQELSKLIGKQREQEERQKEMYKRMLGTDKSPTPPPEPKKEQNWMSLVWLALLVAVLSVIYRTFTPSE